MKNLAMLAVVLGLCGAGAVAAPVLTVDNLTYAVTVQSGSLVSHSFVLSNAGDETLSIESVRTSCGCTTAALAKRDLAPSESVSVDAVVNTTGFRGTVTRTITVSSNDPAHPTTTLRIDVTIADIVPDVPAISPADLKLVFFLLIDVRTAEEYASGHLFGAVSIPLAEIAARCQHVGSAAAAGPPDHPLRGRRRGGPRGGRVPCWPLDFRTCSSSRADSRDGTRPSETARSTRRNAPRAAPARLPLSYNGLGWSEEGDPVARGDLAHIELSTTELAASRRFYGEVFGWQFEDVPGMDGYALFRTPDGQGGGFISGPQAEAPSAVGPLLHLEVADIDATLARIASLGRQEHSSRRRRSPTSSASSPCSSTTSGIGSACGVAREERDMIDQDELRRREYVGRINRVMDYIQANLAGDSAPRDAGTGGELLTISLPPRVQVRRG